VNDPLLVMLEVPMVVLNLFVMNYASKELELLAVVVLLVLTLGLKDESVVDDDKHENDYQSEFGLWQWVLSKLE
jgi:hypothetical protein